MDYSTNVQCITPQVNCYFQRARIGVASVRSSRYQYRRLEGKLRVSQVQRDQPADCLVCIVVAQSLGYYFCLSKVLESSPEF